MKLKVIFGGLVVAGCIMAPLSNTYAAENMNLKLQETYIKACQLMDSDKTKSAVAKFGEILQVERNNEKALLGRAECYLKLGNNNAALVDANAAVLNGSSNAELAKAYGLRGDANRSLRRWNDAIADYNKAMSYRDSNGNIINKCYLGRAQAHIGLKNFVQSNDDFVDELNIRIRSSKPNSAYTVCNMYAYSFDEACQDTLRSGGQLPRGTLDVVFHNLYAVLHKVPVANDYEKRIASDFAENCYGYAEEYGISVLSGNPKIYNIVASIYSNTQAQSNRGTSIEDLKQAFINTVTNPATVWAMIQEWERIKAINEGRLIVVE